MAELFRQQFDMDIQNIKGAGAAGGMGAGSIVFLKADLISGIDLVKDLIDFENRSKHADWIITGEGKLDHQTLSGKTIHGIIKTAKKYANEIINKTLLPSTKLGPNRSLRMLSGKRANMMKSGKVKETIHLVIVEYNFLISANLF